MNLKALFRKKDETPKCSAVIVAAGSSQRMGMDKVFMKLGPMPVLVRTVLAFQDNPLIEEIIIVTRKDKLEEVADLCHNCGLSKVSKVVIGGSTRMESALAGVSEVKKGAKLVAIHDGSRAGRSSSRYMTARARSSRRMSSTASYMTRACICPPSRSSRAPTR